jgi:CheY-like chemotaxis protein/nitrogen-specific signal transduction histidine kinase
MLSTHWRSAHRPTDHEFSRLDLYARQAVDFIERSRMEEALRQASQLKDQFLATLSHELRTPLNAVLGWAQILSKGALHPDVTTRALESLERNAKAQSRLVEDLLDISGILSGKLQITRGPTDLRSVIESALDAVRPAAAVKQVSLEAYIEPTTSVFVDGDAGRLRQVIWNVLSNAVKFSPVGGRVEITLAQREVEAQIVVRDNGVGIDPQFLSFVFERFQQADVGTTRRYGGLGIGLAIAKHITEAHGGTIAAASAGSGQGATFTVRLPAMANRPEKTEQASLPSASAMLGGVRVLVVDDEADARDLLRAILEAHAAHVVDVGSAGEALHALQNGGFDVLIADIGMPDRDGYWLIRAIRQGFEAGRHISAIAATAYAGVRERDAAIEAGYNWHVAKPVEADQLIALVATAADKAPARLG